MKLMVNRDNPDINDNFEIRRKTLIRFLKLKEKKILL